MFTASDGNKRGPRGQWPPSFWIGPQLFGDGGHGGPHLQKVGGQSKKMGAIGPLAPAYFHRWCMFLQPPAYIVTKLVRAVISFACFIEGKSEQDARFVVDRLGAFILSLCFTQTFGALRLQRRVMLRSRGQPLHPAARGRCARGADGTQRLPVSLLWLAARRGCCVAGAGRCASFSL